MWQSASPWYVGIQRALDSADRPEIGPFGPIYREYRHDGKGAIAHLKRERTGEAVAALHHPEIGDIDLVWGVAGTGASDGYGLAKLVKFHPEVLGDLQGLMLRLHKIPAKSGVNRVRLEGDSGHAVVSLDWRGNKKTWLLTAYEPEK